MSTWTDVAGHGKLRSFVDDEGNFWLKQNASKQTRWQRSRAKGTKSHGSLLVVGLIHWPHEIDGEIYTPSEATKKFLVQSD